jgi:hypothetical protein
VHAYRFFRQRPGGELVPTPGFADSGGRSRLVPHAPGTRETVWLRPSEDGRPATYYVVSVGRNGSVSGLSNGFLVDAGAARRVTAGHGDDAALLDVPLVHQARERCGQAALVMVLRFYGADSAGLREADRAYDPVLRGSLITDLASAARRAGYEAAVATLTTDSLIALLRDGVPAIVLYQNGSGPLTVRHYGVVTGWNAAERSFTLHDGTSRPRRTQRDEFAKRWETAGSQALVVRERLP